MAGKKGKKDNQCKELVLQYGYDCHRKKDGHVALRKGINGPFVSIKHPGGHVVYYGGNKLRQQ